MKYLLGYWAAGCLLTGAAVATHEIRCPAEPEISAAEIVAIVATWPAVITYGLAKGSMPPVCKVRLLP